VKSVLCVLLLTAASAADACRCSQQDLAAYFAAAEEVVMARLTGWEAVAGDVPERLLRLELLVPPYKVSGSPGGNAGDPRHYRTAGTSATCGLVPEVGAIYLLFAQRSGRGDAYVPLQVDSCSGSRVFLPAEGGEAAGFTDVPARFVVQQLNGLAGLELLREVAARHPDPDASENDTLVGLLDVAGFSHAGPGTGSFGQSPALACRYAPALRAHGVSSRLKCGKAGRLPTRYGSVSKCWRTTPATAVRHNPRSRAGCRPIVRPGSP
jgi:hypothetical protein